MNQPNLSAEPQKSLKPSTEVANEFHGFSDNYISGIMDGNSSNQLARGSKNPSHVTENIPTRQQASKSQALRALDPQLVIARLKATVGYKNVKYQALMKSSKASGAHFKQLSTRAPIEAKSVEEQQLSSLIQHLRDVETGNKILLQRQMKKHKSVDHLGLKNIKPSQSEGQTLAQIKRNLCSTKQLLKAISAIDIGPADSERKRVQS